MSHPFLERLSQGPILADGAMGTLLQARGVDHPFDLANRTRPELVREIYQAYAAAGAEVIETNTFGANRIKLAEYGLADQVRDLNFRGVKLAREVREITGVPFLIAGSVGPLGEHLEPLGHLRHEEAREAFREQIEALWEAGADLLILETFSDLEELILAVETARDVCDLPLIASATFGSDGRTLLGHSPAEVARALHDLGVTLIGINCSTGPAPIYRVLREMHDAVPEAAFSVMPNAGWPQKVGDRLLYPATPQYFADYVPRFLDLGARVVGGCCGTTPAHIQAMAAQLRAAGAPVREAVDVPVLVAPAREAILPADGPTEFARKLAAGKFVVSVEVDPPRGFNPEKQLKGARLLKERGVDAVNVADSPMARVRMSALSMALMIQQQVGLETILHFTTRDRNLMGLQADLIGAHTLGIRNILALTGDPPTLGDYPDATAVYDVDSIGLIRILRKMNEGTDLAGTSLGKQASFCIGAAVDPTRPDLALEAQRLRRKIEAGAHFIMTQPIYDLDVWRRFLEVYGDPIPVPVLLGILPLQSHRHAEFLHNEVPGITLTDEVRERMRKAGKEGRREGVKIAQELLLEALEAKDFRIQGVYLMPSFGRYEVAAEVLEVLKEVEP